MFKNRAISHVGTALRVSGSEGRNAGLKSLHDRKVQQPANSFKDFRFFYSTLQQNRSWCPKSTLHCTLLIQPYPHTNFKIFVVTRATQRDRIFDITLPSIHKMLAQILNFFPQTHTLIMLTSSIQTHFIFPSMPLADGQAGNARELSKQ